MSNVVGLFAMPPVPKPAGFDDFWAVYPLRKGKLDAQRAWVKALQHATVDEIIASAKQYARTAEAPYIKHPATWLNKGCFLDEDAPNQLNYDGEAMKRQSMERRAADGDKFAQDWLRRNLK